jgi:hypothetical protein
MKVGDKIRFEHHNAQQQPPLIGSQIRFKRGFYSGGIVEAYEDNYAFIRLSNGSTVKSFISNIEPKTEIKFVTGGESHEQTGLKMWEETQ